MTRQTWQTLTRRGFFGLGAAGIALAAGTPAARAAKVRTGARIIILGAGAAGTAFANRLVERLDGARITIVDSRKEHLYQPGLSLIGAGLKPARYALSTTAEWLPAGIDWLQEPAAEIDPLGKTVTTAKGTRIAYDYLVVATGLTLDYAAIEGFSLDMIGRDGVGSVYAGADHAARTWAAAARFAEQGGQGLFTRPDTEMKCAGAPLKHTFLIDDIARTRGGRPKSEITYFSNNEALFSVPIVHEKVRMLFENRQIATAYSHVLTAIDAGRKLATFRTPEGPVERPYDYIHVIPPMRAPDVVRDSPLPWADKWVGQSWVEVDKATLRHPRFPEVFALGDVAGVPKGKTAASVKWQIPVVEDHLIAAIEGREGTARYNGYTSCPMITRVGRAMLVEFDYNNNLVESFPGVVAPLEELWISWLMKEIALKATYNAMLRGRA